jgi:acyl-CoA synthetase (AMP-forming)/AMP-acid ligase II
VTDLAGDSARAIERRGPSVAAGIPQQGLAYVRGVDSVELSSESIGELLIRLSIEAPDQPALMWATVRGAQQLTWSRLAEKARRGAATLLNINSQRRRVALVAFNSIDWIVAMYACTLTGMAVVPISPSVTDEEARHQLTCAEVGLILSVGSVAGDDVYDRMCALADSVQPPPVVRDIATISTSDTLAGQVAVSVDDEFLIQFTSGTTGLPKAASLSNRAALNCGAVYARACGAVKGDRWLNPLPLHHVGGSVTGLVTMLAIGGVYILVERFSAETLLNAIRQTRPSLLGLVPTMIIDLMAMPGVTEADFSSVRTVIGGATSVDPSLIDEMEKRLDITFMVAYGQSEAPAMTSSSPGDSARVRTQTLGRCLGGRDYAVRDGSGAVVAVGEVGELCVRGPLTMSGYLQPDGGMDTALDSEGWRRTGDLCSMDEDGVLTFRGRIREVVIRGGLNIYPAEVEQAVSAHESVSETAVFGVTDKRLGERVVAAVIPAAGATVDVTELAALAEARLSAYKRPVEWIVAAKLPRTSTGKVRKHLLREWHESGTLQANCGARAH